MDKAKNSSSFSDTSFMMSYHEQMKGNEKIQSRPESGRDTPFDLNHLKALKAKKYVEKITV